MSLQYTVDPNCSPRTNAVRLFAKKTVKEMDSRVNNLAFHNLTPSGTLLPSGIRALIGLNLPFCPTPSSTPSIEDRTAHMAVLRRAVQLRHMFGNHPLPADARYIFVPNTKFIPSPAPQELETALDQMTDTYKHMPWKCNVHRSNLTKQQHALIKSFRAQNDLKIIITDKNLGPGIMTTLQYETWCLDHLNNTSVYKQIEERKYHLTHLKTCVTRFHLKLIRTLQATPIVDKRLIKSTQIIIHNINKTTLPYLYGMPKVHKTPMGIRPIVSCCNAPTAGLSKWLTAQLRYLLPTIPGYVKNSYSLFTELSTFEVPQKSSWYTMDIEALYTAIPLANIPQAISHFLRGHRYFSILMEGIEMVLHLNYFTFGTTHWKQIRGIAMGQPVAPIIAILYVAFHEQLMFPRFSNNLLLYKRYFDDILLLWGDTATEPYAWQRFQSYLRRYFPGLTFVTTGPLHKVQFLDLEFYQEESRLRIYTHEKQLNLFLYTTFHSAHPPGTRKGLVMGMLHRFKNQCTHKEDYIHLVRKFFHHLQQRGYHLDALKLLYSNCKIPRTEITKDNSIFLCINYDPNGPNHAEFKRALNFTNFNALLAAHDLGNLVLTYRTPPSLGTLLHRRAYSSNPVATNHRPALTPNLHNRRRLQSSRSSPMLKRVRR